MLNPTSKDSWQIMCKQIRMLSQLFTILVMALVNTESLIQYFGKNLDLNVIKIILIKYVHSNQFKTSLVSKFKSNNENTIKTPKQ